MTFPLPPSPFHDLLRAGGCALACFLATSFGSGAFAQESWNPFKEQTIPGVGPRRPSKAPDARAAPLEARSAGFDADGVGLAGRASEEASGARPPREAVERTDLAPLPAPAESGPVVGTAAAIDSVPAGPNEGSAGKEHSSDRTVVRAGISPPPAARLPTADASNPIEAARIAALTKLSTDVVVPTRSQALTELLTRVVGPRGIQEPESAEALGQRSALLYRAGLVQAANAVLAGAGETGGPPPTAAAAAFAALRTRLALAVGDRGRACSGAATLMQAGGELPASIRAEGIVVQGYCGAAAGNPAAAGLAASLGRELGGVTAGTIAALDAVAAGEAPALASSTRIAVIEWRIAEVAGKFEGIVLLPDRFEPAALVAAALSTVASSRVRIAAAEAAARNYALDSTGLAEAYRQMSFPAGDLAQALTVRIDAWARRALLFKAAEGERTPSKRTRLVRAALDDARRAGLFVPVAAAFARIVEEIKPVPEVGWFAETAVEVLFAAGRFDDARRWAQFGTQPGVTGDRAAMSLAHWMALIDIADVGQVSRKGHSLGFVEDVALRGRFSSDALHRLATALDALDYDVPVRLWEAASRAPQPTTGHLPATGILSDLQDAAKRKEHIRVVGLVFRAVGPGGPEGAHMIALGDTIRALKRAGLEAEARQIAGEALFALWPRSLSN